MAAPKLEPTPGKSLREEVLDKVSALVTVALGLVAALAWNGAVQATFERFFGTPGEQLGALYTYAVVVTIVAVIAAVGVGRAAMRARQTAGGQRPMA